ncbi:MAG: tetratricopeptide repeat protein [Candidatus Thioglobus sp.]
MFTHTDKEEIDQLKRLWKSWGRWIIVALIAGGAIGFGGQQWKAYKAKNSSAASALFQSYIGATNASKPAILANLQKNYSTTPYPALAALIAAKELVMQANWQAAAAALDWPLRHASMLSLRQIARLRLASVLYQQKKYKKALKVLAVISDYSFIAAVNQMRGDIYSAQSDKKQAAAAYMQARNWFAANKIATPILNRRLADISTAAKNNLISKK